MSDKLQELTERLYNDGVAKARSEAEEIIADAEKTRDEILSKAREEAESIISAGKSELDSLKTRREAELALAARQTEGDLKGKIVNFFADAVLESETAGAMKDENLLADLIVKITDFWVAESAVDDPRIVLAKDSRKDFQIRLGRLLADRLDKGLDFQVSDKMKAGFRIEERDGTYAMSFSDEDFQEYFRSFLKDATRKILFGDQ